MLALEPCLLITDDDRAMRETLRDVFQPRGFQTVLASDGDEAVEIVRRQPVHLAMLDMHMPRLSGLEAIREVRRHRRFLPCILFSGALDDAIRRQAAEAEVYSVIAKPIRFADITRLVVEAMRQTYSWYQA